MNSDYTISVVRYFFPPLIISVFPTELRLKIGVIICRRTNVVLAGYKL
jgi:hypothetical protein